MIYLKISLSDFLTLFAARTRTWFWERRPGYALGVACLAATFSSTMMSLFWCAARGGRRRAANRRRCSRARARATERLDARAGTMS